MSDVPVSAIREVDMNNFTVAHHLRVRLPGNWNRMDIPAFGSTSIFVTQHVRLCELVQVFQKKYLPEKWNSQKLDMPSHTNDSQT